MSHTLHKYATTPPFCYTTLSLKWRGCLYSNIALDYMPLLLSVKSHTQRTVALCLNISVDSTWKGDKNCGIGDNI